MRRLLIHSTGWWLSLLLWSVAAAQPLGGGQLPLTLPTPEGPKLNVPAIEPAQPPLMLDTVRPLQMPPARQQPSLGLLPGEAAEGLAPEEPSSGNAEPPGALYLEHNRGSIGPGAR